MKIMIPLVAALALAGCLSGPDEGRGQVGIFEEPAFGWPTYDDRTETKCKESYERVMRLWTDASFANKPYGQMHDFEVESQYQEDSRDMFSCMDWKVTNKIEVVRDNFGETLYLRWVLP